jgi:hypothetical protein
MSNGQEIGETKHQEDEQEDEQSITCSNCGNWMHVGIVTFYDRRDTIDSAGRTDGFFIDIPAYICPVCENWT